MLALAIILGILLLLALMPVGAWASYDQSGPLVKAKLGPVRFQVYPIPDWIKKKSQKPKKTKPPKKAKQAEPAPAKKGGGLQGIMDMLQLVLEAANSFRRKLVLRRLDLCAEFGGTDPAKIAILYGRAWAVLGTLTALLENAFTIRSRNIRAQLGEGTQTVVLTACLELQLRIWQIVALGVRYGFKFLKLLLRQKREAKRAQKLAASAT